jgi:hypothetical protein
MRIFFFFFFFFFFKNIKIQYLIVFYQKKKKKVREEFMEKDSIGQGSRDARMWMSHFLEQSYMMPGGCNLFYMTCSCYKLNKGGQACYAQILIGVLRLRSIF